METDLRAFSKKLSVEMMKLLNKIPRFFSAKSIELIDKLSSSLVSFTYGLVFSLEKVLNDPKNGSLYYVLLKDSSLFKDWHREVEDYLDSLSNSLGGKLLKFGKLAQSIASEQGKSPNVFHTISSSDYFYRLQIELNEKYDVQLSDKLIEIGLVLKNMSGWHRHNPNIRRMGKGLRKRPTSLDASVIYQSDLEINPINPLSRKGGFRISKNEKAHIMRHSSTASVKDFTEVEIGKLTTKKDLHDKLDLFKKTIVNKAGIGLGLVRNRMLAESERIEEEEEESVKAEILTIKKAQPILRIITKESRIIPCYIRSHLYSSNQCR